MRLIALSAVALVCAIALTGCAQHAAPTHTGAVAPSHSRTPIPSMPATPSVDEKIIDTAATSDVGVAAYSLGGFTTTADSGFAHDASAADAFPKGTWVAMFRLSITGDQLFGKADLTGLNYTGSAWDAATDQAVFDDKAGALQAKKFGLPYGAAAAFGDTPWEVENGKTFTYAIAVYMPAGASELTLQLNIPSQSVPMKLRLPVGGE